MIVKIIDNFLDDKYCQQLIDFFESNTDLQESYYGTTKISIENLDKFNNLFKKLNKESLTIKNSVLDWTQIVKWPDNSGQGSHLDISSDDNLSHTSICYLNDGYLGGQTYFEEGTIFKPKKGRIIFFDSLFYRHGVTPVKKGPRYTLATWYKKI
tara:strand:+ start:91 stop:552 length:462 start_codon:yes stop_codon:yes gene_type:complete